MESVMSLFEITNKENVKYVNYLENVKYVNYLLKANARVW